MPPSGHNSKGESDGPPYFFRETERTPTGNTSSKFDWMLVACCDGLVAGTLDLMTDVADERPEIFVRMVRSARAGTASAMLDELIYRYPEHLIRGGPISEHEPGGRQFLRRRIARPTHDPRRGLRRGSLRLCLKTAHNRGVGLPGGATIPPVR